MIEFEVYKDILDPDKMDKAVARAYKSWLSQRYRCNNPNSPEFRLYGAKGLKVHYSSREFIGWWIHNLKKKAFKKPTVGRIYHDLGYFFGNIELQEMSDNGRESRLRCPPPMHPRLAARAIFMFKDGNLIQTFRSAYEAAKITGVSAQIIGRQCLRRSGYKKTRHGFSFRRESNVE